MDLRNVINWEIPEGVVVKVTDSNGVVIWNKGNNEPDLPTPNNNEIYYTSTDGNIVEFNTYYEGSQPKSNTYENGIGKMVFREDLTEIVKHAFYECSSLQSIILPDSVIDIRDSAFSGCSSLQSVVIPDSVIDTGVNVFYGCSSLQSIVLPYSITYLSQRAFSSCSSLQSVTFKGITSIGNYAFYECSSLQSVIWSDGVTDIASSAFAHCSSLQSINIPDSITFIGYRAFYNCTNISTIICRAMTAPTTKDLVFENTGSTVPNEKTKVLQIPIGSKGYEAWLSQLEGFELQYITE